MEEEQLSLFDFTRPGATAGCDEAGRGPLAGPVVVAAVILPPDFNVSILNDSKKLSPKQREEAALEIKRKATAWTSVFIDPEEIDRVNILNATLEGMKRCYWYLADKYQISRYLVDGNRAPAIEGADVEAIVKGDAKVPQIMAASIIAKTERDHYMTEMAKTYPLYGFEMHKGYGTRMHYEALEKYGPTPIHRRTFLKSFFEKQSREVPE